VPPASQPRAGNSIGVEFPLQNPSSKGERCSPRPDSVHWGVQWGTTLTLINVPPLGSARRCTYSGRLVI
jgi:hypothetical protein